MKIRDISYAFCLLALMAACEAPKPAEPPVAPSTAKMANILRQMAERADGNHFLVMNASRRDMYAKQLAPLPKGVAIDVQLRYLKEVLNAGDPDACIAGIREVMAVSFPDGKITFKNKPYFDLLAIAHLRKGELTNCQLNHSAQSCIVPIAGGGLHRDKSGSQAAKEIYLQILESFPEDLQSVWLLNLACMTLGEYPVGVPERFRIPPSALESEVPFPPFADIALEAGVDVNELAGGCSTEDFNGDGILDIFATSYGLDDQARLFLGEADGSYRDATDSAGIWGLHGGLNTLHGDYDSDGLTDIFILRGGWFNPSGTLPNSLLKNLGGGKFRDVTEEAGLLSFHPTQSGGFADWNLDGHLDLFVGNENSGQIAHPSELYVNNGDGTFREVSAEVGLRIDAFVKGCSWGDINNDGLPDLYVSVHKGYNLLYVNRGGSWPGGWKFEEIGEKAGVREPLYSFPCTFWDYDNDGWEDILVFGYSSDRYEKVGYDVAAEYLGKAFRCETPRLYRNNRNETFSDVSEAAGLRKPLYTMGFNIGDLDNDGWPDLYCGTGAPDLFSSVPNRVFRNAGGQRFQDVTTAGGFGQVQKGHGVSFADLDNDGDQDIYTVIGGAFEGDFYRNSLLINPGSPNAWLTLLLEGRSANRSAIGARLRVRVEMASGAQRDLFLAVNTGGSFGASSLRREIGLGDARRIVEVEVRWPGAAADIALYRGLEPKRAYRIVQGGQPEPLSLPAVQRPAPQGGGHSHHAHAR
jgi:hypothetical protein